MEPDKNNKTLLVFLLCCIILFNHAQAICVPRNQSDREMPSSSSSTSKLQPPPISKPPPSPPPPNAASGSVPPTPPMSQPPPSPPPPNTASASVLPPPKSQPPPSPPPNTVSAPVTPTPSQETPDSSADLLSMKTKLPPLQISLPTVSLNVEAGAKSVSDPRIKSLCDKTDEPALCLTSIAPFFNGKSDIPSVIEMLIKAGTEQTKQAIATAAKMATDAKSDPKTVSRLDDCKEIYDDALDNLQEAMDAIPSKDVGTIATMVSAAISDYGTCDDGFTGQPNPIPEGVSPMAKINEKLMNIAGIILAINEMIP